LFSKKIPSSQITFLSRPACMGRIFLEQAVNFFSPLKC
jgi:hypothetical protein